MGIAVNSRNCLSLWVTNGCRNLWKIRWRRKYWLRLVTGQHSWEKTYSFQEMRYSLLPLWTLLVFRLIYTSQTIQFRELLGWSDSLVDHTGPWTRGPLVQFPVQAKLCLLQNTHRLPMLNKGGPPLELPSLWSTRVQEASLLTTRPGRHWVKDSTGRSIYAPFLTGVLPWRTRRELLFTTLWALMHKTVNRIRKLLNLNVDSGHPHYWLGLPWLLCSILHRTASLQRMKIHSIKVLQQVPVYVLV